MYVRVRARQVFRSSTTMESVTVQAPAYIKLDMQSRGVKDDSSLFSSVELGSLSSVRRKWAFLPLHGKARKAALAMIALSLVGWILFVLSFGIYRNRYTYVGTITDYPELYWAWAASIIGPVTYVLALIHAVTWNRASAAIGSTTAILGIAYTATMGYALITCGIFTYEYAKYSDNQFSEYNDFPDYVGLMFAGSFISCFFWGLTVALWPWYADGTENQPPTQLYYKQ